MLPLTLIATITSIVIGASFQFGYQVGVLNAPQELIIGFIANVSAARSSPLSDNSIVTLMSLIVSALPIGGVIGALSAGFIANTFGRRKGLLLLAIPTFIGSVFMFICRYIQSYEILIVGRLIIGMACGAYSGVGPMYLNEIAPLDIKGASGTLHQFAIVFGVLFSQILGLPSVLGTVEAWHYLLGFSAVPCIIQCLTLPFCPESPHYVLYAHNDEYAAESALLRLRGTTSVRVQLDAMITEQRRSANSVNLGILDLFKRPHLRFAMWIAIGIHMSQQLSGINAVMFYSASIFSSAGMSHQTSVYATLGVGVVNLLVTFISVILVDRAGRRTLHLTGLSAMFFFTILLTVALILQPIQGGAWSAISVVAIYLYVSAFAIGPGSIPWFIVAEMFSQESRGSAVTVSIFVNWLCQIVMGLGYPQLLTFLKEYSFVPFIFTIGASVVFTYFLVPETKGLTSEEMERSFIVQVRQGSVYANLANENPAVSSSEDVSAMSSSNTLSFTTKSMVNAPGQPLEVTNNEQRS